MMSPESPRLYLSSSAPPGLAPNRDRVSGAIAAARTGPDQRLYPRESARDLGRPDASVAVHHAEHVSYVDYVFHGWYDDDSTRGRRPLVVSYNSKRKVTSKADCTCRQAEISQLLQRYELGTLPSKPQSRVSQLLGQHAEHHGPGQRQIHLVLGHHQQPPVRQWSHPAIINYGMFASLPIPAGVATINFDNYVSNVDSLPFDHHLLAGPIGPRPLYVMENVDMGVARQDLDVGGNRHCSFPSSQQSGELNSFIGKYLLDNPSAGNTNIFRSTRTYSNSNMDSWSPWAIPNLA
ncbi:hypothetical protein VTK56DRAFT_10171 [Thermocarpiscus australiensis]